MTDFTYVGSELDLFATATTWKSHLRRQIQPYVRGAVLEVGAGLGGTTAVLCSGGEAGWVCLEPDGVLANLVHRAIESGRLPSCCSVMRGTIADIPPAPAFDTILYIDVLEHMDDDVGEVRRALERLRTGGHLVALSPAHQWLFTPFDASIGHYRRYTRRTLNALTSDALEPVRLRYLDSVGLWASLANRFLLQSAMPTSRQIAVWDRILVRLSRVVDPLLGYQVGKSVLGVWRKR